MCLCQHNCLSRCSDGPLGKRICCTLSNGEHLKFWELYKTLLCISLVHLDRRLQPPTFSVPLSHKIFLLVWNDGVSPIQGQTLKPFDGSRQKGFAGLGQRRKVCCAHLKQRNHHAANSSDNPHKEIWFLRKCNIDDRQSYGWLSLYLQTLMRLMPKIQITIQCKHNTFCRMPFWMGWVF